MMRNKPSSSLQKTYDECYLICSTAIYFEGQNNEAEALRSWRNALDQIHYHNAYRVPANYRPKTETEKALQESLREMEMQCKERVDLLEALRLSRLDSKSCAESIPTRSSANEPSLVPTPRGSLEQSRDTIGEGTIPAFNYPDLSRPAPPLPQRPVLVSKKSSGQDVSRIETLAHLSGSSSKLSNPPSLPVPPQKISRSPSPEKKTGLRMTLRSSKDGKRASQSSKSLGQRRESGIAAAKAATQAWGSISRTGGERPGPDSLDTPGGSADFNVARRRSYGGTPNGRSEPLGGIDYDYGGSPNFPGGSTNGPLRPPSPSAYMPQRVAMRDRTPQPYGPPLPNHQQNLSQHEAPLQSQSMEDLASLDSPTGAYAQQTSTDKLPMISRSRTRSPLRQPNYFGQSRDFMNSSKMLPPTPSVRLPRPKDSTSYGNLPFRPRSPERNSDPIHPSVSASRRKNQLNVSSPCRSRQSRRGEPNSTSSTSGEEGTYHSAGENNKLRQNQRTQSEDPIIAESSSTPNSAFMDSSTTPTTKAWDDKILHVMKNLPKGVDETAAKQIFNEIVLKGDEVHWDDVAGLDSVKLALKEAVVYPFLRPDLFMGLREPARGMLLFGPPGTGKTMLARAVATESRSTFFSISASSLTSKYLGESEKLVRALFQLAKAFAPSIIFVDEIDSLLSSRSGSSEHEATRRIKTEFLIQWSDLQRAAAGREQTIADKEKGDASRVLVLAATNLPWAIDEAARRRFVRRQYIPLPEGHTRAMQLRTLLGHQKHGLTPDDIEKLVDLTEGFSGSDITALAKDAAMGPLRSLGEALLHMSMDQIRPIQFDDFKASLINIRPSVSKQGLKEFEDWAREFGERGG